MSNIGHRKSRVAYGMFVLLFCLQKRYNDKQRTATVLLLQYKKNILKQFFFKQFIKQNFKKTQPNQTFVQTWIKDAA